MNIETTQSLQNNTQTAKTQVNTSSKQSDFNFSDELTNIEKTNSKNNTDKKDSNTQENKNIKTKKEEDNVINQKKETQNITEQADEAINGLSNTLQELNKLNHSEDTLPIKLKTELNDDDINNREIDMIDNNDINIREREILSSQMNASMNFNSSGQPFSDFMNQDNKEDLSKNANELAEEKAIMSTMTENYMIAKARSNTINIQNLKNETVTNTEQINNVIMTRSDVDFFAALVDKNELNMNEIQNSAKAGHISKTLADMLADSMKNNKPLRIDFDNDISVIIKISREGKISADFLPSSQIAEAYLRDNLPILRQKFDENNIDYDELNQRKQKQEQEQEQDNKKKGGKNE